MIVRTLRWLVVLVPAAAIAWLLSTPLARAERPEHGVADLAIIDNARLMLDEGRRVFRFETFGDEAFWGDTLKLHQAIAGSKLGGVGPGVSPKTALSVGVKVDVAAVPAHDGRFPTVMAVVEHYNQFLKLGLSEAEKRDFVEYLKSL